MLLIFLQTPAFISSPPMDTILTRHSLQVPRSFCNKINRGDAHKNLVQRLQGGQDFLAQFEASLSKPIMKTGNMSRADLRRIGLEMERRKNAGQSTAGVDPEAISTPAQEVITSEDSATEQTGCKVPKRKVTSEVMDAMHTFAWMPLCPQTRQAFMLQVPVKDMVQLLSMPVDAVECDHEESVFVIALRCLQKLCSGSQTTEGMERVLLKLGVGLDDLGPALSNCLQADDSEIRSGSLKVLGLFTDEHGGQFVQTHRLQNLVVKLLGDADPQVVNGASEAMHKLVQSDAGLAAIFSGDCLGTLEKWLSHGVEGVGMRVAQVSGVKEICAVSDFCERVCPCLWVLGYEYIWR